MKLSKTQRRLLLALADGQTLKSHRYLSGAKVFRLHPLHGPPQAVRRVTVESLHSRGLIDSNKKFPSATYWLTDDGKALAAAELSAHPQTPQHLRIRSRAALRDRR